MGNKYEVWAWKRNGDAFAYEGVYLGESFVKALYNFYLAKRRGHGCVKLEWR